MFPIQKLAIFRKIKEIKEYRGGVQVVRRTSDSEDRPQRNRPRPDEIGAAFHWASISQGRPRDCGKGQFLDGN